jgi:hypothetical protein
MEHKKTKNQKFEYLDKIECDKCHKVFDSHDFIDWQEAICHRSTGGYGSVFGDGATISLDLCQECFKEICGAYIIVT